MKTWAFCFSTAKAEAMAFRARCVLVLSKRQCGTLFQSHNATIMFLKGMMVFLVLVVGSLIAISNLESSICRTLRNGIFIKFQDLIIESWTSFQRRLYGKSFLITRNMLSDAILFTRCWFVMRKLLNFKGVFS